MKTSKLAIRYFIDFDKEEKWLNDMSREGWCFWHANWFLYRFKACTPGEMLFQIDFDEKKSSTGEDYVVFRNSCGDTFVHQWKNKLYWKRKATSGPFDTENNALAKLKLTNKAYDNCMRKSSALTIAAAIAIIIIYPFSDIVIPGTEIGEWLGNFSLGVTIGILLGQILILLPMLNRLRKKMKTLLSQIF